MAKNIQSFFKGELQRPETSPFTTASETRLPEHSCKLNRAYIAPAFALTEPVDLGHPFRQNYDEVPPHPTSAYTG